MCETMLAQLKHWTAMSTSPRVMIISGTGGKAFCAGGNLKIIHAAGGADNNADKTILREFFAREYLLDYSLYQLAQSSSTRQISVWNGVCMGAGVGLSWFSPIRIATELTVFAMPEAAIGYFTDVGASYFLARVRQDVRLGLFLGLTGHRLRARELVTWGIATHYITSELLPELYATLASNTSAASTDERIDAIVAQFSRRSQMDLDEEVRLDAIPDLSEIQHIFQADSMSAIIARLANSETEFAARTRQTLSKMSPLSLAVTFELLTRGSRMTHLIEAFRMEFAMTQAYVWHHTEFFEGIRALLIDKDNAPRWQHQDVSQVSSDEVSFFFDR